MPTTKRTTVRTLPTLPPTSRPSTTTTTNLGPGIWDNVRLPTYYVPKHYDLWMKLYRNNTSNQSVDYTFEGFIAMHFNLTESTNEIMFHAYSRLAILDVAITGPVNITITNEWRMHVRNQFYYIKLNRTLNPGAYVLHVNYKSTNPSLFSNSGVYGAKYLEDMITK